MVFSKTFPNGLSSKQSDEVRTFLYEKYGNPFIQQVVWTNYVKRIDRLLNAISMLESCYAYGGTRSFWVNTGVMYSNTHYEKYLDDYLSVGGTREEFDKVINNQLEHLKRCRVYHGVYTDFEGCTYNSIGDINEKHLKLR